MTDTGGTEQEGTRAQELVQIQLILDTVPDVAVYPADWQTAGAQYLYRRNRLLAPDGEVDNVRGRLGIDSTVDPDFALGNLRRLIVETPGEDSPEWSLPDLVAQLRDSEDDDGARGLQLDHLFYVCIHSCAAIEPVPTLIHRKPIPRPSKASRGDGVSVLVFDNGLVAWAAQSHHWMHGVTGDPDPAGRNGTVPQDGGHGTFTAGCVRVAAPAAEVRVVNAAALLPQGPRTDEVGAAFDSDLADLVRAELEKEDRPDVVVLNFAGTTQGDLEPPALARVHTDLIKDRDDLLVFSPAGNEGEDLKTWPGAFDGVISVGALTDGASLPDAADPSRYRSGASVTRASWSNYGESVDVYAPGDHFINAYATGSYTPTWQGQPLPPVEFAGMAVWSGTSFSTPLVAGMVAARKSVYRDETVRAAWDHLEELAAAQWVESAGPSLLPGQELD